MNRTACLLFCCLTFFSGIFSDGQHVTAQTLIKSIPLTHIDYFDIDPNGTIYVTHNYNTLTTYSELGDSIRSQSLVKNGAITDISVNNPLNIVVLQASYNTLTILDRMLAPKMTLSLNQLQLFNTKTVATSSDGSIWLFDEQQGQLLKLNKQLQILLKSNDLRHTQQLNIEVSKIIESNDQVILLDTQQGIFFFDRYANFIKHYAISNIKDMQVIQQYLCYETSDTFQVYDMETKRYIKLFDTNKLPRHQSIKISDQYIYLKTNRGLEIYSY